MKSDPLVDGAAPVRFAVLDETENMRGSERDRLIALTVWLARSLAQRVPEEELNALLGEYEGIGAP